MGPHRVGMVSTPAVEATAHPNALRLNLNSWTLTQWAGPLKRNARVIQPCFDVIKHWVHFRFGRFGDELLFGTQHVLNVHFGSRPIRSKHKDCVFVPPKSTIFPPLYGARLVWPISLISFAVFTAGSWRRPGVDAEKHVACVRRYLRLQVHEISLAAVAGLCRGIVCADCIPFAYCHVCGGTSIFFGAYCHVCGGTSNRFWYRGVWAGLCRS